jgi:hypothetical protein
MHKPVMIIKDGASASPTVTTQNKPINPALQGNVLQKGAAGSTTTQQQFNQKHQQKLESIHQ